MERDAKMIQPHVSLTKKLSKFCDHFVGFGKRKYVAWSIFPRKGATGKEAFDERPAHTAELTNHLDTVA